MSSVGRENLKMMLLVRSFLQVTGAKCLSVSGERRVAAQIGKPNDDHYLGRGLACVSEGAHAAHILRLRRCRFSCWTESTCRANSLDFAQIKFRQRVGHNLERRSTRTTMAGQSVVMPVALAPTGLTGMQHAGGEILAARAAERFGAPFTHAT